MRLNFKRLGLLCGKAARACARMGGLTSARADLMAILLRCEHAQVELATILCVSPPVVSKMLKALEALGFVHRRRLENDRRYKICSLTSAGRERALACLDDLGGPPPDGAWSAQCLGEQVWTRDWQEPFDELGIGTHVRELVTHGEVEWLLFFRMRHWNLGNDYADFFDASPWPAHSAAAIGAVAER